MSYGLIEGPSNSLFAVGYSQSWTNDTADAFVLQIAGDGTELRRRAYGDARANYGFVLRPFRAGHLLGGWSTHGDIESPLLIRMDASGEVVWQRDIVSTHSTRITDLKVLSDGSIVVVGQRLSPADSLDAVVLRLDAAASVVWETIIGGSGRDRGFYVDVSDADIVVQGLTTSTPADAEDMLLAVLDREGNLLWRRSIGGAGYQTGHGVRWTAAARFWPPDMELLAHAMTTRRSSTSLHQVGKFAR